MDRMPPDRQRLSICGGNRQAIEQRKNIFPWFFDGSFGCSGTTKEAQARDQANYHSIFSKIMVPPE